MAWLFSLNAECGPSEDHARELARLFDGWPSRVFRDGANWWCGVIPEGLSRSGVSSDAEATAMTTAGQQLYELLRTAPPVYRYALAGVETDEFRTYDELTADGEDLAIFPGLVISDDIWATVGKPTAFGAFVSGYRWIPYNGERYIPPR